MYIHKSRERHRRSLGSRKFKELDRGDDDRISLHTINTISIGFTKGRETHSSQKRYAHYVMEVEESLVKTKLRSEKYKGSKITFPKKGELGKHPHDNDHVVITMHCDD